MYISRTRLHTPCHKSPTDHNIYLFPKDRQKSAFSNSSFKQANSYLPSYWIQREKSKNLLLQQSWEKILLQRNIWFWKEKFWGNTRTAEKMLWCSLQVGVQTPALTIHSDPFTTVQYLLPVLKFLTAITNAVLWYTKEVTTYQHLGKYGAGCSLNPTLGQQKTAESLPLAEV